MSKKTITITLAMTELTYDVMNKTYLTGRSRSNGNNHEEVANMQANEDDENLNQILRSIGNAFAQLKTKLSEFIVTTGTTANNTLLQMSANMTLSLTLSMPSNFNAATNETISATVHQYIVNTAIGDWFTITDKNDAADYVKMADNNLEQLREAVNKRVRPERRVETT